MKLYSNYYCSCCCCCVIGQRGMLSHYKRGKIRVERKNEGNIFIVCSIGIEVLVLSCWLAYHDFSFTRSETRCNVSSDDGVLQLLLQPGVACNILS